jgi:hypothetical protein
MLDVATFLITLYVMADEYVQAALPPDTHPGPAAALSRSEVLTLAIVGQWRRFESERAFYRYAKRHLRPYFPTLPRRSQFNRLLRRHRAAIATFGLALAQRPEVRTWRDGLYEALDGTAAPVRQAGRRGHGWLAGQADKGWSTHLGWYWGLRVLAAVTPGGAITGFGVGPASANERPLAEAFFATRHGLRVPPGLPPPPPLPPVPWAGQPVGGHAATAVDVADPIYVFYATDTGFEGADAHARWAALYGVRVVCPPKRSAAPTSPGSRPKQQWPRRWRRWLAGLRQIVETVFATLQHPFRLLDERPHDLTGFLARLAAKVALHNFCLSLNCTLGRARLAFADLIDWP